MVSDIFVICLDIYCWTWFGKFLKIRASTTGVINISTTVILSALRYIFHILQGYQYILQTTKGIFLTFYQVHSITDAIRLLYTSLNNWASCGIEWPAVIQINAMCENKIMMIYCRWYDDNDVITILLKMYMNAYKIPSHLELLLTIRHKVWYKYNTAVQHTY